MPCEMKPRFVLLYGSQKGQAQSIAEGVAEVAEEHGLVAELSCLDQNEKVAIAQYKPLKGLKQSCINPSFNACMPAHNNTSIISH